MYVCTYIERHPLQIPDGGVCGEIDCDLTAGDVFASLGIIMYKGAPYGALWRGPSPLHMGTPFASWGPLFPCMETVETGPPLKRQAAPSLLNGRPFPGGPFSRLLQGFAQASIMERGPSWAPLGKPEGDVCFVCVHYWKPPGLLPQQGGPQGPPGSSGRR